MKIQLIVFLLLLSIIILNCNVPFPRESDVQAREIYFVSEYTKELSYFLVYVPQKARTPVPVLYLLNGYLRTPYGWDEITNLQKEADDNEIIIVSLTSGINGDQMYVNSIVDTTKQYESYVLEIIKIVDDNFDTRNSKYFRGICGISNGAMGAIYIASRHPDMFVSASALSGGIYDGNISIFPYIYLPDYNNLNNVSLLIEIGTSDAMLDNVRRLHDTLSDRNIPHLYNEDNGGHTNAFMRSHYKNHIKFHCDIFNENR